MCNSSWPSGTGEAGRTSERQDITLGEGDRRCASASAGEGVRASLGSRGLVTVKPTPPGRHYDIAVMSERVESRRKRSLEGAQQAAAP